MAPNATLVRFNLCELINSDSLEDDPTYQSGEINLTIPDNSARGATSSVVVRHHNLFIEHVLVRVSIDHPYIGDIELELSSPPGKKSKLMTINKNILPQNFIDGAGEDIGKLVSWKISFLGNRGKILADVNPPEPVSDLVMNGDVLRFNSSVDSDLTCYEICVHPSDAAVTCSEGDFRSLNNKTSLKIKSLIHNGIKKSILSGVNYTAQVCAVDTSENLSAILQITWWEP